MLLVASPLSNLAKIESKEKQKKAQKSPYLQHIALTLICHGCCKYSPFSGFTETASWGSGQIESLVLTVNLHILDSGYYWSIHRSLPYSG
uniref:Uncharacterized protein n=1 Tax=Equus asinus TaxID=9793 RepID=A0A8C4PUD5_EQUAS